MQSGILKDLIVDGIIGGVGGVIVFLPNILILFFIISLMEDTGYMARAVFIMDRVMHRIGLHGKSFIPLVIGFGCNVPAIMATRTLESRNDRLLTMLIVPFMSCSARLPVFVLFIGTFFPVYSGSMLFLVYIIGMLVAAVSALILKKVLFSSDEVPFVMELPVYRTPHMKTTAVHMWHKGSEYLKKIGSVILVASIIIWALGKFPQGSGSADNEEMRLEQSYIGSIGHFIEPVIRPLGFDWKIGVCLASGLAAKEIVVSTMGVMYGASGGYDADSGNLSQRIRESRFSGGENAGKQVFAPLTAFCLIIFVLIYSPCAAVIATIKRESGSWRWALFAAVYTTTLAWLLTFLIRHIGLLIL
jgi:ferrous iron transport protein B